MWGRIKSDTSVRILTISRLISPSVSRMRLLASTISSGSMKMVLPVADSSCTIPFTLRLCIGATGSTRRPSRTDGAVSASKMPLVLPCAMTLRMIPLIPAVVDAIFLLKSSNRGEALSFTLPNLSSMRLAAAMISGKDCMPTVSA